MKVNETPSPSLNINSLNTILKHSKCVSTDNFHDA